MLGRYGVLASALIIGCGGNVQVSPNPGAGGSTAHAGTANNAGGSVAHGGSAGIGGHAASGGVAGTFGVGGFAGALAGFGAGGIGGTEPVDAGQDVFVDPGCPDSGPPVESRECEPFAPVTGCPPGEGCYPFVDHPNGSGCGAQSFGTVCLPAGDGAQGADCGENTSGCAPGFVCVVGAKPGKHCVQLCPLDGTKVCPDGLVCGVLDVEGYGVCS